MDHGRDDELREDEGVEGRHQRDGQSGAESVGVGELLQHVNLTDQAAQAARCEGDDARRGQGRSVLRCFFGIYGCVGPRRTNGGQQVTRRVVGQREEEGRT